MSWLLTSSTSVETRICAQFSSSSSFMSTSAIATANARASSRFCWLTI